MYMIIDKVFYVVVLIKKKKRISSQLVWMPVVPVASLQTPNKICEPSRCTMILTGMAYLLNCISKPIEIVIYQAYIQ